MRNPSSNRLDNLVSGLNRSNVDLINKQIIKTATIDPTKSSTWRNGFRNFGAYQLENPQASLWGESSRNAIFGTRNSGPVVS